ncbi:hypothetical protein EG68_00297 [Paragonimus skrjabini miyazakii]|uniref:Uncharacterized protein n=1 Tax=Paragonimus skrjabini miyazakii TaxID=59628 RepID=A0A8S9Z9R7_9TREM|nr:hypothetical protein EG68_00297 [Paragonimus skrjabini miyazakii]
MFVRRQSYVILYSRAGIVTCLVFMWPIIAHSLGRIGLKVFYFYPKTIRRKQYLLKEA